MTVIPGACSETNAAKFCSTTRVTKLRISGADLFVDGLDARRHHNPWRPGYEPWEVRILLLCGNRNRSSILGIPYTPDAPRDDADASSGNTLAGVPSTPASRHDHIDPSLFNTPDLSSTTQPSPPPVPRTPSDTPGPSLQAPAEIRQDSPLSEMSDNDIAAKIQGLKRKRTGSNAGRPKARPRTKKKAPRA